MGSDQWTRYGGCSALASQSAEAQLAAAGCRHGVTMRARGLDSAL
ncbi:hypothetical protein PR003_g31507 [Phytophthora rubi]|uniref:Uncharacterized protein n=1 Tax=Phytophthora rubi TaxID=129364 RepID=A0A6A4B591_9STRA|nr:hypothetical protein PR003_g31507 [Phytophthora rubi]